MLRNIPLYFFLLISVVSFSQEIHFQTLNVEDGLSQPTINSIYQDEFGLIWIATKDGLNVYNGSNIQVFRPKTGAPNSLFNNNVGSVCGDRNGHIYVRCKYAVAEYDMRLNRFYTIRDNHVQAIAYGSDKLWVCASDSVYTYDNKGKKLKLHYGFTETNPKITSILESSNKKIYIGTQHEGLYVIDENIKCMNYFPDVHVISIYEDSKMNIWVSTRSDGLIRMDRNGRMVQYKYDPYNKNSIADNYVRSVCEDNFGNYWIGTFKGLNKLDISTGQFTLYQKDKRLYSLSNSSVVCISKDQQGTLWIGTYYGGINMFNPEYEIYKYYYADDSTPGRMSSPFAGRMLEDKNSNIWLATEGGGLNYLDRKTKVFTVYKHHPDKNSIASNTTQGLYLDEQQDILWIGSVSGGLDRMDIKTKHIRNYRNDKRDKKSLINNSIRKILPFKNHLILMTHDGICIFDPLTGSCSRLQQDVLLNQRFIIDMILDKNGNLWFSHSAGLTKYNLETNALKEYTSGNMPIEHNLVNVIFQDKKGRIWIGTSGSGIFLYEATSDSFKVYNSQNSGLVNDFILDIKESLLGYLLIASNQGFSRFDTENQQFYNYNEQNGFPLTSVNAFGIFVTNDDEIFLAGPKMMISFYEKELNSYVKPYQLNFTSLEVNNKQVLPNDDSGILQESLLYQSGIRIKHNYSVLTIHISLSNYVSVLKNKIYYKLEGFDDSWIDMNFRNSITYTNLNPGKYKLRIKSVDASNEGKSIFKELDIIVMPPFYRTVWAYILYVVILIIVIYLIASFYSSKLKLSASLELEKREKAQIERLNQSKLRFFTNISHEFRTPLTLIISQLEMLIERTDIKPQVYNKLVHVHRNGIRMKRLVTELLDFRKQEQGYKELKFSKQDIYRFLEEIYLSFKEYSRFKDISLIFLRTDDAFLEVWFDVEQMEKAVNNLLSNAFKYTHPNGSVTISVEVDAYNVYIRITDTGIGIPADKLERIFDRFYQIDEMEGATGTGLGLAITREIIYAHQGDIRADSKIGKGTSFVIRLPLNDSHILNTQKAPARNVDMSCIEELNTHGNIQLQEDDEQLVFVESNGNGNGNKPSILIVEDNLELLELLERLFSSVYQVFTAVDGIDGMEKALEKQPDIILSDIMMPRMSGIEMCRKIKENFDTSHIPVILLTAQNSEEYLIQGLKMSADDYITKPFSVKHLFTRCNNLVNNRRLLQSKYAGRTDTGVDILTTNNFDQQFLTRCVELIENNIGDADFDVNRFAREIGLGRTKLFLKIKGITGQTPNGFILNVRLKKSRQLLEEGSEKTVSEIAYEVGFNSPSYFIKRFKELYGMTPIQFQKK
ncbi:MAG: two-component regulator propeller domain-containing protein [Paludibacter sp.]|nr:two-component regulator propeller domain-containing protein [Paludibacter sp.]